MYFTGINRGYAFQLDSGSRVDDRLVLLRRIPHHPSPWRFSRLNVPCEQNLRLCNFFVCAFQYGHPWSYDCWPSSGCYSEGCSGIH